MRFPLSGPSALFPSRSPARALRGFLLLLVFAAFFLPPASFAASSGRPDSRIAEGTLISAASGYGQQQGYPSGYGSAYPNLPSSYSLPPGAVVIDPNSSTPSVYTPIRIYQNPPDPEDTGSPAPTRKSKSVKSTKQTPAGKKTAPQKTAPAKAASGKAAAPVAPKPAPAKTAAPATPKPAPALVAPAPLEAPQPTAAARVLESMRSPAPVGGTVQDCWKPLLRRLQQDSAISPEVINYFCSLPAYSPDPMATKVKELFKGAFMRKKPTPGAKPSGPPSRIYRSVVTAANVAKCNDFLAQNKRVFDAVEKKYPVPRRILVSLLMVETRLGTYIGRDNAFWSLACMALADKPELVKAGLGDIPITSQHDVWLQEKLTDKSNWAYKELRALLKYCSVQGLDPHSMPGSVYGAIGVCQFMPSNLVPYGDDGDGDGVVNLFSVPDAIFSAAKYLNKHGWTAGIGVDKQRSVLKRYNNLNIYANTILALAESIRTGVLQTGPPDAPKAAAKPKAKGKAAAKSKAAPKSKAKSTAKPKPKTQ